MENVLLVVFFMQLSKRETCLHIARLSHPVLRPKPDAHRMYAQDQVVIHTARM
jgi:hypothetical protein